MKKQQWTVSSVVSIQLSSNEYAYGHILTDSGTMGFFDVKTKKVEPAINEIAIKPYLFSVWVMRYAITSGRWRKIGKMAVDNNYVSNLRFFMQDHFTGEFSIYDDTNPIDATYEDVIGLECAAAWDPEHVEDRLRDHFAGRPNIWVNDLKPRLNS